MATKVVNKGEFSTNELDTIIDNLQSELHCAVTKDDRDEIKRSIVFFKQEQRRIA